MTTTASPQRPAKPANPATVAFRGIGQAAKAHGLGEQFATIARMVKNAQGVRPSVVVVGEMNRGKSTLINALLAAPGLAPTAPIETTALAVSYMPATKDFPQGTAELEFASEPQRRRIPAQQLPGWVQVDSPIFINADEQPLQATLSVRPGYVPNATLVDTPGSGGLSEAYAMRAIQRSQNASVLLLVTDASGRITAPALEFLVRCSATVDQIVLAVTKIDLYRGNWQAVLEENRAILAQREPRLGNIPIVGVSGAWGERAAAEPDDAKRARLLDMSGIPNLAATLRDPLKFAGQLPTLNALRRGADLLRQPLIALETEREALGGVVEDETSLTAVKEHRDQLLRKFEDAKYDWGANVDRVRVDLTSANSRLGRDFAAHWKELAQSKGAGMSGRQSAAMMNEMAADVEVQIGRAMNGIIHRSAQLLTELYAAAGMDPQRGLLVEVQRRAGQAAQTKRDVNDRKAAGSDPRMLMSGFLMGGGIGSMIFPGIGTAIGAGVMGSLSFVLARRQAKRQSVIQVVADAATEMRETLDRTVRAVLGVITTDAKKVFDRDLRESANAAKSELQRLESARRASEAERKQRIANLDPQIRQLREAIASAEREAERIEEKRRAPNPDRRP
ncbi:dynamin family protein [Gulosibacter faecalis]|jgi:hypothetical protein|uniref:Dynamin family protein n=1 Tax=Gulosibacter faecalis TaxID=272240 RepID=A0ABW5V082_9MICO|nr:dynamin family protein [Gulosibacter faecalis]